MDSVRKAGDKPENQKWLKLSQLVLESLRDIDNGSVTIIKQDDHVIQINKNSRIFMNC